MRGCAVDLLQERERYAAESLSSARHEMENTQEENALLAEEIDRLHSTLEDERRVQFRRLSPLPLLSLCLGR